jgi:hypothetical protein
VVQGAGARLELACANEPNAAATVEGVLRGQALRLGEVSSVRWEANRVSVPAQVPLRLAR